MSGLASVSLIKIKEVELRLRPGLIGLDIL